MVSDDDSSMSAAQFDTSFRALNPTFAGYTFHGIVTGNPPCGGTTTGTVYLQLIALTGGYFSNLCNEDVDVGLDEIADKIIGGVSCDIQLNQTIFGNGNPLILQVFKFANTRATAQRVEVKVWLEVPGVAPIGILNTGTDGSFVLAPGSSLNLGPATLFTIAPQFPRGPSAFSCRFVDPVTAELKAVDLNPFIVQ